MNSVTVSVSAGPIASNTVTSLSSLTVKGQVDLTLDLTGISEVDYNIANLVINWGDGTPTQYFSKDLIVDYTKASVIPEILYGKPVGSIAKPYSHIYNTLIDQTFSEYILEFVATYENGYTHEFNKNVIIYPESFYDTVKDLKILSTQITPTADNFTVANLQGANGYSYITTLATEPVVYTDIAINLVAPLIVGNPWDGSLLSASPGVWTGNPYEFYYQWRKNGDPIVNAFMQTWNATGIDDQDMIDVLVTAVTDAGTSIPKNSNVLTGLTAPVDLIAPMLSGVPIITESLSSSLGVWGGSPSEKTIKWRKNGVDIPGADTTEMPVDEAMPNHGDILQTRVTATNVVDSVYVDSDIKAVVLAPFYISGGFISGNSIPGQNILAFDPTYGHTPVTYIREWYKNGSPTGSTGSSYSDTAGNDSVYCSFSAYNIAAEIGPFLSNTITLDPPPVNDVLPIISGDPWAGSIMYATPGEWSNLPTSYSYQWYLSTAPIVGQTSNTINISAAGLVYKDMLRVGVVATNDSGNSLIAYSEATMIQVMQGRDYGAMYWTTSAVLGELRFNDAGLDRLGEEGSMYWTTSAVQSTLRNALIIYPEISDNSSLYWTTSAVQSTLRYSEQILSEISDSSSMYWSTSAVRGRLQ